MVFKYFLTQFLYLKCCYRAASNYDKTVSERHYYPQKRVSKSRWFDIFSQISSEVFSGPFGNLLTWVLATFVNYFMTVLAALSKIS